MSKLGTISKELFYISDGMLFHKDLNPRHLTHSNINDLLHKNDVYTRLIIIKSVCKIKGACIIFFLCGGNCSVKGLFDYFISRI